MTFPHEIHKLESKLNSRLLDDFTGERTGFVQVGQQKWFLPSKYEHQAVGYHNMTLRSDDIWVVTFPRSGTTWTQELLWLLNNDFDYDTARRVNLVERFPFLEFSTLLDKEVKGEVIAKNPDNPDCATILDSWETPGYRFSTDMTSPRHFKTHLPLSLLPPQLLDTCKVVYVARNPKDVAVSYYHHNRLLTVQGYQRDFATYWNYFEHNLLIGCPYWSHLTEAWDRRNHPNMMFLFYEELSKDIKSSINKIAQFLGKHLSVKQMTDLATHLHIDNFRNNPAVSPIFGLRGLVRQGEQAFIRTGKVGGNSDYFTPELNVQANHWIERNLQHTDLRFPC
uniref:Sulfotransferase domain-containing protein n=1 Tax=Timema monikensis TaxID=170555 RepID=A0A7R9EJU8_9NEOP|nr:unnamed protein product [Timema monikensis]